MEVAQHFIDNLQGPATLGKEPVTEPIEVHQHHDDAYGTHEGHDLGQPSQIVFSLHNQLFWENYSLHQAASRTWR